MHLKKLIGLLVIIIVMMVINKLSSQTAEQSDSLSNKVIVILGLVTEEQAMDITNQFASKVNRIIRKLAHFSIYFGLSLIIYLVIYLNFNKSFLAFWLAWIISTFYALFDEYYQTSIEGRGGEVTDVIIDSSGALTAAIMCSIIVLVITKINTKKSLAIKAQKA